VKKNLGKIQERLIKALASNNPTNDTLDLIKNLRKEFKPLPMKNKSHFKVIEKLFKAKDRQEIRSLIIKARRNDYLEFLACLEMLEANRNDKE
jgi:hypothetical protein